MSSQHSALWVGLAISMAAVGCQTMPAIVPCPLPSMEQAAKIQDLVPIGTPREAAIAKLKEAGIEGNFGTTTSIFYCDTWAQGKAERWHINVELLFDERGELYAYRPDPENRASRSSDEDAGTAQVTKPPKAVATAKRSDIIDPFAE